VAVPRPVGLGLIGCGRMGRAHLAAIVRLRAVQIVAVCDPALGEDRARELACPAVALDELVRSAAVEAVVIAAPTAAHESLVRTALAHGLHVLCEKPLTLDPGADDALAALAAQCGRVLQIGFWRRFAEPYVRLREVLVAGRIGAVTAMRAAQWDARAPAPSFCDPRVSGGIEIDCGVHEFDLARWLLGSEIEALASCAPPPSSALAAVGDVDTVLGLARMHDGAVLTIDLTRTAGHRDFIRTEIIGERGSAIVEFAARGRLLTRVEDRLERAALESEDVIADALRAQLAAFAAAIRSGQPSPDAAGAEDSRRALVAARCMRDARLADAWRAVSTPVQPSPAGS
jgi:predicted dehydrogenase